MAEADDALLEKYLEGGELTQQEVSDALKAAVAAGSVCPVIPVAATKNIGSDRLLETLLSVPSPVARGDRMAFRVAGGEEVALPCDYSAPTALFVFKTIYDQFSGRVNLARIFSGKIATDTQVLNDRTGEKERTGNILLMQGKETKTIEEAGAGDIVALAKLKETGTGDTLSDPARSVRFPRYEFPPAAISFAISPKTRGDEEKVSNGLRRLGEEDPAMELRFDPQTKEMLISGTSQVHVEVILDKLKRRFGVEVELHPPQVPYRETIRKKATAQGRHKKQTGGRGQFGDCWIEVEPLPRSEGYQFEDAIFGGSIPRNFIPAVEKGIVEAMEHGVIAGYPVVDVKVKLFDGSYHTVDSSELAFKLAGDLGVEQGHDRVGSGAPGAGDERRGDRTRGEHGRHHGRPVQPTRASAGQREHGGDARHQGPGAPGRDADVRAATALHDGGARFVHHRVRSLRRGAVASCREDRCRRQGSQGGRIVRDGRAGRGRSGSLPRTSCRTIAFDDQSGGPSGPPLLPARRSCCSAPPQRYGAGAAKGILSTAR